MSDAQLELGEETEGPASLVLAGTDLRRGADPRPGGHAVRSRTTTSGAAAASPPAAVAEACLRWLLDREAAERLPEPFDCARARRSFPDIDVELPERLGKPLVGGDRPEVPTRRCQVRMPST